MSGFNAGEEIHCIRDSYAVDFFTSVKLREQQVRTSKVSVFIYSTLYVVALRHTQGTQAWTTQSYLQVHQCLPLPRKRSPDGASPD